MLKASASHPTEADPPEQSGDESDPSQPCLFQRLPAELLQLIFAYFQWRACLRVLGLVCRRWRREAVRSIKVAPPGMEVAFALQLFPALESITLRHPLASDIALPPTLKEVKFSRAYILDPSYCFCPKLGSLTTLTSLSIHQMPAHSSCNCTGRLLKNNADGLMRLVETSHRTEEVLVDDYHRTFETVQLPRLEYLAMNLSNRQPMRSFFRAVLTRMLHAVGTELAVTVPISCKVFPSEIVAALDRSIPLRLTRLTLDGFMLEVASLREFLTFAPHLTELTLNISGTDDLPLLLRVTQPVLVGLSYHQDVSITDIQPLEDCTKLRQLFLQLPRFPLEEILPPHASRLQSIEPLRRDSELQTLQLCTALTNVTLHFPLGDSLPFPRLPYLRALSLELRYIWFECLSELRSYLPQMPVLKELLLDYYHSQRRPELRIRREQREEFRDFLRELEWAGVERVSVQYVSKSTYKLLEAFRRDVPGLLVHMMLAEGNVQVEKNPEDDLSDDDGDV